VITWRAGRVVSRRSTWPGARELDVEVDPEGSGRRVRALAYTDLVGDPEVGSRVALNVGALDRGLGTGGLALVVAPLDDLPSDPPLGPGHLVKARYTPLQALVLGVDEQESSHHDMLRDADDLDGLPVVVADLHSAVPAIVAGARHAAALAGTAPPRITYVLTDGGALPVAFSRTVAALREAGWIDACVSVGQAYGGDVEAVTVHTGLLAARHVLDAELAIVAQGPGNLGTGTRWGFSGVAVGDAVNAVATLGGRPVASLRVSGADARPRHRGVSHHSLTAYGRVALRPADVVVPAPTIDVVEGGGWPAGLADRIASQAAMLADAPAGHHVVTVEAGADLVAALAATPTRLSTMGRGLDADPAAFVAAAVAGVHAQGLITRAT
jgi:hypothetical protein